MATLDNQYLLKGNVCIVRHGTTREFTDLFLTYLFTGRAHLVHLTDLEIQTCLYTDFSSDLHGPTQSISAYRSIVGEFRDDVVHEEPS